MAQINAGILQPIDFAGRVREGFQHGQQQRRQMEMDKALQALAANPNDPQAIAGITRYNPQLGMQLQSRQAEAEANARAERVKVFGAAARMAKNPEQWDLISDKLVELGYSEAAAAKGKFSPETRSAYMAAAGLDDSNAPGDGAYYNWLKQTFPDSDFADRWLAADIKAKEVAAQGAPIVQRNDDNTITVYPRWMIAGATPGQPPQGGPQPQGQQASAPPPPPGFVLDGGPTPQASGGFPVGPR
jgi:hypothetical protein